MFATRRIRRRPRPRSGSRCAIERLEGRCLLQATATAYAQVNLVSDGAIAATFTNGNLVNPLGLATTPTGAFWVANNGTGTAQAYDANGQVQSTQVAIPLPSGTTGPAAPTGEVFTGTSGFLITANGRTGAAQLLFATEQGTIAGFNSSVDAVNAVTAVDNSGTGAVYRGLATGTVNGQSVIYATDFHNRKIDVFNTSFTPATLTGTFTDPFIPRTFAPFGIANINGQILVSYARQDAQARNAVPGGGSGIIDAFTSSGVLVRRLVVQSHVNAPWGMTLAPANFGQFSNDLLVSNTGNGTINAFNPSTGTFLGTLHDTHNVRVQIDGLSGLSFGSSGSGATNSLFFTAGPNNGAHGLFGRINVTSLPAATTPTTVGIPGITNTPINANGTPPAAVPLPPNNTVLTGSQSDLLGSNSGSLLG